MLVVLPGVPREKSRNVHITLKHHYKGLPESPRYISPYGLQGSLVVNNSHLERLCKRLNPKPILI